MEPPNKDHVGSRTFLLYLEVVLISEVPNKLICNATTCVHYNTEVVCQLEGSVNRGFAVLYIYYFLTQNVTFRVEKDHRKAKNKAF